MGSANSVVESNHNLNAPSGEGSPDCVKVLLDAPLGEDLDYLIRTLRHYQVGVIERMLAGLKLPLSAWYPLVALSMADGISQRELASRIGLKDAGIGKAIDGLARAGLVGRSADEVDGRKSIIALTTKGRRIARKLTRARSLLLDEMQKGFSPDEISRFRGFLTRAYANLLRFDQRG